MDFRDRHIVVSGGAGALGTAVVEALVGAGAICHVPCLHEAEKQSCRLRESKNVRLTVAGNLADEAVVARFYQGIAPLWASIHIAGGFAMAPMRDTTAELLRQQLDMNFVSCALCCRAAVQRHGRQRRPHRQCFRPRGPGMALAAPAWWPIRRARRRSRR